MNELFNLLDDWVLRMEDEGVPLQEILSVMDEYLEVSKDVATYENQY